MISSAMGNDFFHGVHNSDRFIEAVQKKIEDNKYSSEPVNTKETDSEAVNKLSSMKQMLDKGIITNEEFEKKKAEILSKI